MSATDIPISAPLESGKNRVTDGPIVGAIFYLALPIVANMLMHFILTSTDFFWVGRIGSIAQDAITTGMLVIWTLYALVSLVGVGVTAIVARYFGAKQFDKASFYAGQGLVMGLLIGAILSIAGYMLAPTILAFMQTSPETTKLALGYLRINLACGAILFLAETLYAVFRAVGNTRLPFQTFLIAVLLNIVLDPLLIFGYGPFPRLGVNGAAIATVFSEVVACTLLIIALRRGKAYLTIRKSSILIVRIGEFLRIGKIGLPMAAQQLTFVLVYWFLIQIVHRYGPAAAAAMGIGNRMESFSYLTCNGISLAAATMVGQNLGAQKPDRAERSAWMSIGLGCILTMVTGALLIAFPQMISRVFTHDSSVIPIAVDYLIILGLSQMFMAVEIILEGAFGGAGDTIPPMIVMLPGAIIRIPLAWYLCFSLGWGINGVWWTLTITTIVKATILAFWFRLGRWKTRQV